VKRLSPFRFGDFQGGRNGKKPAPLTLATFALQTIGQQTARQS
jgi:hypothetical protein